MVKKMKGLSVVIPCYTKPNQVISCITHLLRSTGLGKEFSMEIIIVDGSPNRTVRKVYEKMSSNVPESVQLVYRKELNTGGIAGARNLGVSVSKNGIILAVDSDIEVEKDSVLRTIKTFKDHKNAAMVAGNVYWRGGPLDGKIDRPRRHDRRIKVGKTTYIEMTHGRAVAFLKSAFNRAGKYDETLFPMQGEGPDISIRFWRAGLPIVYNPEIRFHHLSGYKKGEKTKSYLYHGWNMKRTILMHRSMLLFMYKYGFLENKKSNWMKTISLECKNNFGMSSEYVIFSTLSEALDWIMENKKAIEKSKKKIPKKHDFKPYDVFTDKKLFMKAVKSSKQ